MEYEISKLLKQARIIRICLRARNTLSKLYYPKDLASGPWDPSTEIPLSYLQLHFRGMLTGHACSKSSQLPEWFLCLNHHTTH